MNKETKILVLSDLHICDEGAAVALRAFAQRVARLFPDLNLDLHIAEDEALESLAEHIRDVNPHILVIAGDITALGDKRSLQRAKKWLGSFLGPAGGLSCPCLIVPGNHDALLGYLLRLQSVDLGEIFQRLPWRERTGTLPLRGLLGRGLRHCLQPLEKLLREVQPGSPLLGEFKQIFDGTAGIQATTLVQGLPGEGESQVALLPFVSVSSDFLWMNAGSARTQDWRELRTQLRKAEIQRAGTLKIVVTHHNPISSPGKIEDQKIYAYNGMPGGTDFLRKLQEHDVDLVLYGHQHTEAAYLFDFELKVKGHCYGMGAPSATHSVEGGTLLLTVRDVNHVDAVFYSYDPVHGQFNQRQNGGLKLPLERNRPDDATTTSVRYEVKHYSYHSRESSKIWEELQASGETLAYMSGRRFGEVTSTRFSRLREMLESGARVRILSNDPEVLESLEPAGGRIGGRPGLWGPAEELGKLASDARQFFAEMRAFAKKLSEEQRKRLDVRKAHTLLSFGAFVRDADRPWGKMVLKILPVGAFGELPPPVLKLNRRVDRALFCYYLEYFRFLLRVAEPVGPEFGLNWSFGSSDLRSEFGEDLYEQFSGEEERRSAGE